MDYGTSCRPQRCFFKFFFEERVIKLMWESIQHPCGCNFLKSVVFYEQTINHFGAHFGRTFCRMSVKFPMLPSLLLFFLAIHSRLDKHRPFSDGTDTTVSFFNIKCNRSYKMYCHCFLSLTWQKLTCLKQNFLN